MLKSSTYRLYYFLIFVCLGLLISFLTIWNLKTYNDEVASLRRNLGLSFVNVIRDLEGNVLKEHIFDRKSEPISQFLIMTDSLSEHTTHDYKSDYKNEITITGKVKNVNKLKMSKEIRNDDDDLTGVMSLNWIVFPSDSNKTSEFTLDTVMFDRIKDTLAIRTDSPFEIIKISNENNGNELSYHGIMTPKYKDLLTGETYMGQLKDYQWTVLGNIWPQMLFSFLLFGSICTAFILMLRSLKAQERLAAIKNDFVSNMTHELKTPITTVNVALEALSNFNALADPVRTEEYIDISKKELNRLSILVDKVLKMVLFEKREPELKLESIDMKVLVSEVVNSMKIHFEKFRGDHKLAFSGENFIMEGDKTHLTSVIYNLIDNALKYSPNNPKVNITVYNHPEEILLTVADNGLGIDKAFQNKIFEKFFRVPTGDRHTIKGHGLGLAYVAGVIKKHHGVIELDSNPGEGSKFTITLPRKHDQKQ